LRISALVPNLATNCIVRSWPILKVLERHHEVEVIGWLPPGESLFAPYAKEFDYKVVEGDGVVSTVREVERRITGDVLYAFKPLMMSFGAALLARARRRRPLLLDIEDWEAWTLHRDAGLRHAAYVGRRLLGGGWTSAHSEKYRYVMEQITSLSSARTVVSGFLRRRFGGTLLRHGADTRVFDPEKFDGAALRDKWGIGRDLKLILFTGQTGAHKGIADLLEAIDELDRPDVRLLMAGSRDLPPGADDKALHLGLLPHSAMPELLAMADLVALPQRRHPVAEAQIPGKVFEAMAMAKPVIATSVSDLPELLEGCGVIVDPQSPSQLAAAIAEVLSDDEKAAEMGARGRERHRAEHSWDAMERVLDGVLRPFSPA